MKCPPTPSEVNLTLTNAGRYERSIGKWQNGGYRRFRFGTDEATAKVQAWQQWQRWEQGNCDSWEALEGKEESAKNATMIQGMMTARKEGLELQAIENKRVEQAEKQNPMAIQTGWSIAEATKLWLDGLQRRIGLIGSLGIVQSTFDLNSYRINRALAFLPSSATKLAELNYQKLEEWIYAMGAKPKLLPNPFASKDTQKIQATKQVSQATALSWINGVKSFLVWASEDERINYILPRHARQLWQIRPEALEEQNIREITSAELTKLWLGCNNSKARTKDKGKRRRLFLLLGLNCGFGFADIATLTAENIKDGFIWKLRHKTRKTNSKLARTKWLLWKETAELLKEYMPLKVTKNNIRMAWVRLNEVTKLSISFGKLRKTGAMMMERYGGRELADMYLAHSRKGIIDSYSHPDWAKLSSALERMYSEFISPALAP